MSARDQAFLLHEWLEVERLTERKRFAEHSRDTFDAAVELAATVAAEHFAPHNRRADLNEPTFDGERVHLIPEVAAALSVFVETGMTAASLGADVGGLQFPQVVAAACASWFQAANVGTSGYPFLTRGAAGLLLAHGSKEQIDTWVRPMAEGRYFGTMCLSEPQAGSSLADLTTKAERQPDGTYRLTGSKMWISGGDHELTENIVHLVLARVPGSPAGVKGISLFVVPKYLVDEDGSRADRNDIVPSGLNHKMGYRGTANAALSLGDGTHRPGGRAGAVGYLVGEECRGLAAMFHMMNEARIGVGAGAMALGYTGYLKSVAYARTRTQGRALGDPPSAPPVPIIEHPDVRRMLLAQKSYVEGALALILYCARLVDEEQTAEDPTDVERAHVLLEMLTPIAKSWPSQWCLAANDLAIQVHGGYGYTRDCDVEQHYRDNRLNAIHEGTHGIQALDLLGRKVTMQQGAGLAALLEEVTATLERAEPLGGEPASFALALRGSVDRLGAVTARLWGSGDPALTLANATAYLEATGHVVVAWLWLEQVLVAHGKAGAFYDGKRAAARYFYAYELPRTGPQLDLLEALDRTTLDLDPAVL